MTTKIESTQGTWDVKESYDEVLERINVAQTHNLDFIQLTIPTYQYVDGERKDAQYKISINRNYIVSIY